MLCPLRDGCAALMAGDPELYPVKKPKSEKTTPRGAAFVALRPDGAVFLRKRPAKGLLGGMTAVPTSAWTSRADGIDTADAGPFPARWRRTGEVEHVFTHFRLLLTVFHAEVAAVPAGSGGFWSSEVAGEALPTVMKKAIESALPGATKRLL